MNTSFAWLSRCFSLIGFILNQGLNAQQAIDMEEDSNFQILEQLSELENLSQKTEHYFEIGIELLDLNKLKLSDLTGMDFLTSGEAQMVYKHLQNHKPVLSVLELQTVQGIALNKLRTLINHCFVAGDHKSSASSTGALKIKNQTLLLRWNRKFESSSEHIQADSSKASTKPDPNKVLIKWRGKFGNRIKYGLTMEKDAEEDWLIGHDMKLPDFISAHLEFRQPGKLVEQIIVGDYSVSFGLGLLIDNGSFFRGIPGFRISFNHSNHAKPYTSIGENEMLRGLLVKWNLKPKLNLVTYISHNFIDSSLDTFEADGSQNKEIRTIRFQESGIHSSDYELSNRKNQIHRLAGFAMEYKSSHFETCTQLQYQSYQYDGSYAHDPLKVLLPQNRNQWLGSVFYKVIFQNISVNGEFSSDSRMNSAIHNSLIAGLGKRSEFAAEHYYYSPAFNIRLSQTPATGNQSWNQTGVNFQFNMSLTNRLKIALGYEMSKKPWVAPDYKELETPHHQYHIAWTIQQRRKWLLKSKIEFSTQTVRDREYLILQGKDQTVDCKIAAQLFYEWTLNRSLIWRTRIQFKQDLSERNKPSGFYCAQDFLWKKPGSKLNFNARLAFFDIENSSLKIYVFENDVLHHFGIHAHTGSGFRYYFNVRLKLKNSLSIETKLARTVEFRTFEKFITPWTEQNSTYMATCQLTYLF
ncbi:MAG: hypothetical protein IPM34_07515 [Saprospiraceae bacterium]|nr:hypothetical protein [Saprospiraceae bacterium]